MAVEKSLNLPSLRRGNAKQLTKIFARPKLPHVTKIILSLIAISGNTILTTFLNGALTVALPTMAKSIHLSPELLSWPLAMFSLTSGALLLICGAMADAFGRRNVFLLGSVVFAIFSLATSFAHSAYPFIACHAGLGFGAALLIPSGVGILGSSIPEGKIKNRSFALLGAAQPIGFIVGLIFGGLLSNRWEIIFRILTAVTLCFGICGYLGLPQDGEELVKSANSSTNNLVLLETSSVPSRASFSGQDLPTVISTPPIHSNHSSATLNNGLSRSVRLQMFDWFGAFMSTAGLIMLTFALADAESAPHGWKTSYVIAMIPVSVMLLLSFIYWEKYLERRQRTYVLGVTTRNATFFNAPPTTPLVPPSIWRAPKFSALIAVIFLSWCAFNVTSYLSTLVYQEIQHISPSKTSVLFLPMVGSGIVLNVISGALVGRINAIWLILLGDGMGAIACLILSEAVEAHTAYYKGMLWIMILQVGPDLIFPAGNLYACKCVGRQHQALAGSIFNTTVRISTSLGLAIASTISTSVSKSNNKGSLFVSAQALIKGYQAASWFCFGCAVAAIVVSLIYLRNIGIVGGMEGKVEDQSRMNSKDDVTQEVELSAIESVGVAGQPTHRR